jgi:hypothetical protein
VNGAFASSGARFLLEMIVGDRHEIGGPGWRMIRTMALVTVLLSAADHWTTYLCLRTPLVGWEVTEANPIADWLFGAVGLVPGLLVDSALTLGAVGFLVITRRVSNPAKLCFFGLISAWTGFAVVNNLQAISTIGLSLVGTA